MKSLLLTNEYPPNIYGGAGVHVDYLSRELKKLIQVDVRCFGEQDVSEAVLKAKGYRFAEAAFARTPKKLAGPLQALDRCVQFNADPVDADVVHCHTWYSHFGGMLAKMSYGIPLVITTHSLEPLRPWKREQLGRGYDLSSWIEKTAMEMADAIIAVSEGMKQDVLANFNIPADRIKVIYNGIDTDEYRPTASTSCFERYGVDPNKPYVLFVGRITRQKGIIHLVRAIQYINPEAQIVLCAGAPDTPEIAREMAEGVNAVKATRKNVIWIEEMVDKKSVIELYSHAAVFCCPSIYEPFGIINLEAMACSVPVVASAVGGIREVVVHGETGYLVPLAQMKVSPFEALNSDHFARDLADPINRLLANEELRKKLGAAGRQRAVQRFSWKAIAYQTVDLYKNLTARK